MIVLEASAGSARRLASPAIFAQFLGQSSPLSEELLRGEGSGFAVLALTEFLETFLLVFAEVHALAEAEPDGVVDEPVMLHSVLVTPPFGLDVLLHVAEATGFAVLADVEAVGGKFLSKSPAGQSEQQEAQQGSTGSSKTNLQHRAKVLAEMCRWEEQVKRSPMDGSCSWTSKFGAAESRRDWGFALQSNLGFRGCAVWFGTCAAVMFSIGKACSNLSRPSRLIWTGGLFHREDGRSDPDAFVCPLLPFGGVGCLAC